MHGAPLPVSDLLSNLNDQLASAALIIGRSKHRQAIFGTVYRGKKQVKTIDEIAAAVKISPTHVLVEGGKMAGLLMEKVPGGYKKKNEFASRYKAILAMARDRKKLERLPTKTSPKANANPAKVTISFPSSAKNAQFVTVDQIDSFRKVHDQGTAGTPRLAEKRIKRAFARIIGERGAFRDWGGEKSDLYTAKVKLAGKRVRAAIAFKGKGTSGKLVPAKMGKNADQINRLFDEPADLFLVVYGGQVDPSIICQMQAFAVGEAMAGRKVYYGVVDGTDLGRLVAAYPKQFK